MENKIKALKPKCLQKEIENQELNEKFGLFKETCGMWERESEDLRGKIDELTPKCNQLEQENIRLNQKVVQVENDLSRIQQTESDCRRQQEFKDQMIFYFKEV